MEVGGDFCGKPRSPKTETGWWSKRDSFRLLLSRKIFTVHRLLRMPSWLAFNAPLGMDFFFAAKYTVLKKPRGWKADRLSGL